MGRISFKNKLKESDLFFLSFSGTVETVLQIRALSSHVRKENKKPEEKKKKEMVEVLKVMNLFYNLEKIVIYHVLLDHYVLSNVINKF